MTFNTEFEAMRNDLYQPDEPSASGAAGLTSESDEGQALLEVERQLQAREIECDMRSARIKEEERQWRELKAEQEATIAEQLRKVQELAAELRTERELLGREREEVGQLRQVHEALFSKQAGVAQQPSPDGGSTKHRDDDSSEDIEARVKAAIAAALPAIEGDVEEESRDKTDHDPQSDDIEALDDRAEEDAELVEAEDIAEPEPERRQPARAATSVAPDEDQSIEDYMAGLLNRMRGSAPAPTVIAPEPKRNKRKSDPVPEGEKPKASENAHAAVRLQQVVDMPMGLTELTRRSQPASTTSYAAMRELANNQARIAIDTHGKKEMLKATLINAGLAVTCFAGTLGVYTTMGDVPGLRTGSMAILIGGVYWLLEAIVAGKALCADVPVEVTPSECAAVDAVPSETTAPVTATTPVAATTPE